MANISNVPIWDDLEVTEEKFISTCGEDNTTWASCIHDNFYPLSPPSQREIITETIRRLVVPSVYGLIVAMGLVGNSLVIYVIITKMRKGTMLNILLLNLAVSDLLLTIFCMPLDAINLVLMSWLVGGDFGCKLMHYMRYVSVYLSTFSLLLVSFMRYLTIVHSREFARYKTTRNAIKVAIITWVLVLLFNIPLLTTYQVNGEGDEAMCNFNNEERLSHIYYTMLTIAYLIPVVLICVIHMLIIKHLNKHGASAISQSSQERKRNATRLIIVTVVAFAICWLPFHMFQIASFAFDIHKNNDATIRTFLNISEVFTMCLAYLNSCINPFIYNFVSKDFRKSFKKSLCCVRASPCCASEEEPTFMSLATQHSSIPLNNIDNGNNQVVVVCRPQNQMDEDSDSEKC
ncbi:unnamed protein product [Owenia fusiformis]|uniref:G-protein coupled receptors family 1 profile domain-containing protein n=1 Tax=Owenia fusiformis TaxID=6347 RepID=A0A8S4PUE4_OWEFU|nr:unnamed protein product [Owenia fusiformis]